MLRIVSTWIYFTCDKWLIVIEWHDLQSHRTGGNEKWSNKTKSPNHFVPIWDEHIFNARANIIDMWRRLNDYLTVIVDVVGVSIICRCRCILHVDFLCATKSKIQNINPFNIESYTFAHAKYLRLFRYYFFVWRSTSNTEKWKKNK